MNTNSNQKYIRKVAKEIFNRFDKDKSGFIEKDELRELLITVSKQLNLPILTEKEIEEGLKQLDNNNDGKLQFDEFLKFYEQLYEEVMKIL